MQKSLKGNGDDVFREKSQFFSSDILDDGVESEKFLAAVKAGQITTHQPKSNSSSMKGTTGRPPGAPTAKPLLRGYVRATPYGNCIESSGYAKPNTLDSRSWHQRRFTPRLEFVPEGFDHVYGPSVIQSIDGYNDKQQQQLQQKQQQKIKRDDDIDEDDGILGAYQGILYPHHMEEKKEVDAVTSSDTNTKNTEAVDGNEYGSIRTPLDAPVGSLKEKWRLLPYFLQLRSLMRQHIDSFDYFVNFDMKKVVQVRRGENLKTALFSNLITFSYPNDTTKNKSIKTLTKSYSFFFIPSPAPPLPPPISHPQHEKLGQIMIQNSIFSTQTVGLVSRR